MNIKQYSILLSFSLASSLYGASVTIVNNTSHNFNYTIIFNRSLGSVGTTETGNINAGQSKNFKVSYCAQTFMIKSTSVNAQGQFIEKSIRSSEAQFNLCYANLTFTIKETDGDIEIIESKTTL